MQQTDTQASTPDPGAKPYAAPALTVLGSVEAVTAGPDNGSIDQLVGGGGGFRQSDPTS